MRSRLRMGVMGGTMNIMTSSVGRRATGWAHLRCVHRDAAMHAYVGAYALAGFIIAISVGVPQKFVPLSYVLYSLPVAVFAAVIGAGIWALCSGEPFAALRRVGSRATHPEAIAAAMLFVSISVHMGVFTSIKTMLPDVTPFHADAALADVDVWIHGAAPWHYTTAWIAPQLLGILCPLYFGVWGLLLPGCLIACIFWARLRPVRNQYLWTHLLLWPLLGNVTAALGMSAGPVFYGLVTGDTARFAGLVQYLSHYEPLAQGTAYLWHTYSSGQPGVAGGISAFPSMHLANATMFVMLASRISRTLLATALVFLMLVLLCSVHLGWHYAVDGYFSIAATMLLWTAVGRILRVAERRTA